jgi:hypothetical protein
MQELRNDWVVFFKGKWYQLKKQSQYYAPINMGDISISILHTKIISLVFSEKPSRLAAVNLLEYIWQRNQWRKQQHQSPRIKRKR